MAIVTSQALVLSARPAPRSHGPGRVHAAMAGLALAAFLIAAGPLFLCTGPTVDSSFFDVCAQTISRGGILYRDVFLHGPPGMVWAQTAIRAVFGWRSEILRAADLALVVAAVGLLVTGFLPVRTGAAGRIWVALAMLVFYLSRTEWSHCQPDVWMLVPALAALRLRCRSVQALASGGTVSAVADIAEGVCWGLAVLLKPFVIVPAVCCWLAGVALLGRGRRLPWARLGADLASVLFGVGVVLGLAALCLWQSDDMPYFVPAVLGPWNREYFETGSPWPLRLAKVVRQLYPWSLVHLAALPLAGYLVVRPPGASGRRVLLAAFYLGWFVQANFVQRQYDYQLVPPILLAMCLLAREARLRPLAAPAIAAVIVFAVVRFPLYRQAERDLWLRCVRQGSTAQVRNALGQEDAAVPDWVALEEVAGFLRARPVGDGELTCYSFAAVPLYAQLDVRPSSRYVLLWSALSYFPGHREQIGRELAAGPQRFVVNDLQLLGFTPEEARTLGGGRALPRPEQLPGELAGYFPWTEPMIFRRGRYVVHEVRPRASGPSVPLKLWWARALGG